MENLEQQLPVPNISIDGIAEIILQTIASIVQPGENGESPQLDLDVFSPAPIFIGAMSALCDAYIQLSTTEEHQSDYLHALADIQSVFTHFLIDKNVEFALQSQGQFEPLEEITQTM